MHLGDIIKQYRIDHSMSMDKFAKLSGLSKSYVALLEKHIRPNTEKPITPSIPCIKMCADAMHMDFNALLKMIDDSVRLTDYTIENEKGEKITIESTKISRDEDKLIEYYRKLSNKGKEKLFERIDELVLLEK